MQMQGVAPWQEEEEDIKQSIGDGRPCPGLMAHNERSLLHQPCLTLSHIISPRQKWAGLAGSGGGWEGALYGGGAAAVNAAGMLLFLHQVRGVFF